MELFLAIAVAAAAIATLVLAMSFRRRTEKQVSAMLDERRDTAATNNETAVSELRAQLSEGLARLDQLTVGLQAVQEFLWPMPAPGEQAPEAASPADNGSSDPGGDGLA
jgi:type VI protein secretion system component VasK